ncbi:MAG: hypothetical protein R6W72_12630 [Desulfurivibrionaceae bacterium]
MAAKLGIDRVAAEILPEQKVDAVKKFQEEGRMVAMAGGGRNPLIILRNSPVADHRGGGHEPFLGVGGRQCPAIAAERDDMKIRISCGTS